jgi:glycosyltransferase involved in cell wall biosynthesis
VDRIKIINIGAFVSDTSECFDSPDHLASLVTTYPLDYAGEFEKLLGAIRHLLIDGYEFMFVIAGSGKQERQVRKLVNTLGLSDTVVIVPKLSAWRSILAAGDIFIKPQPSESLDAVLLEAMAVGAAVACCKGGVDGLIIDGRTATVFEPDDELSIYNSLQKLLNRREYARQLANQAKQYLRENHSVASMIAETLKAYSETQQWYKTNP